MLHKVLIKLQNQGLKTAVFVVAAGFQSYLQSLFPTHVESIKLQPLKHEREKLNRIALSSG